MVGLRNPQRSRLYQFSGVGAKGTVVKKLEDVQLDPGWLAEDVRKAQSRLAEWHGRAGVAQRPAAAAVHDEVPRTERDDRPNR